MTPHETAPARAAEREAIPTTPGPRGVKFPGDQGFQREVRRRVDAYFRATGKRQRDCPQMYFKVAVILAWFAISYALLVFVADAWWQALPLAVALGMAMGAIGFNIQHDGGHHACSRHDWVNKLMAMSLDMVGGSSYLWHWKHAVLHHTYVNITGEDTDIDMGFLARVTPHQQRWAFHRWQQWYVWLLYGWMTIRWQLYADFRDMLTGRIGDHRIPRPKGWDLVVFLGGKAVFLTLAFAIPLLFHTWWVVLLWYGVASLVLGVVMAVVFQLAHCVEQADFPMPRPDTQRMDDPWAVHQVQTTVDFARNSRVVSWLLGGLNFQIEHHLFPRISHVNYPGIAKVVEETCRDFGVRYAAHATVWAGVLSHFRWLRRMGQPSEAEA